MFQDDWVMRQVESIVNFLTVTVLGKKTSDYEIADPQKSEDTDDLHRRLFRMVRQNQLNEAENLLFEKFNFDDQRYMELAVDFYAKLNALDDKTLKKCDFSRVEIADGLKEVAKKYGVPVSELFPPMPGEAD